MIRPAGVSIVPRQDISFLFRFGQREYNLSARTHIMGILNVTPDSFSDGGRYLDADHAVDHALQMIGEGADFIDVGGESTRPKGQAYGAGAEPVSVQEELDRTIPVIRRLSTQTSVPISIDTWKAPVAARALDAGAVIVNDISGLTFDPGMAATVGLHKATAVLMHIKGTPTTMQANPVYDDLLGEIKAVLSSAVRRAREEGVAQVILDPGIGFGKSVQHNFELIRRLHEFTDLGCPILVGPSRKSFLGAVLDLPVGERLEGTLAACVASVLSGAHIIRVHDVQPVKRAVMVADAIRSASPTMSASPAVRRAT
jgi:dihydropteroate synthase